MTCKKSCGCKNTIKPKKNCCDKYDSSSSSCYEKKEKKHDKKCKKEKKQDKCHKKGKKCKCECVCEPEYYSAQPLIFNCGSCNAPSGSPGTIQTAPCKCNCYHH